MLSVSNKGWRLLASLLTLSLILGSVAVIALGVFLVFMALQGNLSLPLLLGEGIQLSHALTAVSLGSYIGYSLLLVATLLIGLSFLFLLRSILISIQKAKGFSQTLPTQIKRMAFLLLVLAYAKQLLMLFAFSQDLGSLSGLLEFRFQLLPSEALYALTLLLLGELFRYGLALQSEYEQTV
ncbi:DUF2975 domain-containing protein [Sphaerochaeta globosa]|uniref:DUF2975 domain-containing protein n=1 Tax=Sphaerochaeta globosa (strain ATCC BAA-1886 / DSM 22777 / Buddy) TaxID=158189 RepID=F0RSF1_SPHGB|nr:DUF2975 domain-containing protein [Sphaerochaeta globosa]ADY14351.1 hypothetical protein SpiBuddy_2540 [Sphaerochaeta globosa str. Buddy]